jgi:hypothetical protein
VCIDPYALVYNQLGHLFSLFIFLRFRSLDLPPKAFGASVSVFAESPRTNSET